MDRGRLEEIIKACRWSGAYDGQIDGLLAKLDLLATKGKYRKLLSNIESANDRSNFVASILEATIAYQFEANGLELEYEMKQDPRDATSIDFRWKTASGETIYIEVRLLQQDETTSTSIAAQLRAANRWAISKNGEEEGQDTIRVQRVVLEKVQREDGTPRKFLTEVPSQINLVAVDVSEAILGTFDFHDCKLVTHGDAAVDAVYQRGLFGLFQEARDNDPDHYQSLARHYSHIRRTLHGILFLFRRPQHENFNFSLAQVLICNPALVDLDAGRRLLQKIKLALPLYRK